MPFIHGPASPLGPSGQYNLNFLWCADGRPVYVMDNHLAALWCWLKELQPTDAYSLLHIDYHWDDIPPDPSSVEQLRRVDGQGLPAMLALQSGEGASALPSVRFDNYMQTIKLLRPELKKAWLIAHDMHANSKPMVPADYDGSPHTEMKDVARWVEKAPGKVIINLDVDFFFVDWGDEFTTQGYSDNFIGELVTRLRNAGPQAIWTIAWSPEFCGDWGNAAKTFRIIDEALDLSFPFEALGF